MDFGIGPAQRLLLKAAFSSDTPFALAALEEWWAGVGDFSKVQGTDAALFPQIHSRLGAAIRDPQLAARIKGAARHHWVLNQHLVGHCTKLLDVLLAARVPVLLLKGAAISVLADQNAGLRAMSDWDILVPRAKIADALRLLADAGVDGPRTITEDDLVRSNAAPLQDHKTGQASFDLHWRPLKAIGADELTADMFASGKEVEIAGRTCLACCPEHIVFHAIVNGAEWSPFPRYDWMADTIKLLRRFGTVFDWPKLVAVARRYRYEFLVGAALREITPEYGVQVPKNVLRDLLGLPHLLGRCEARLLRQNPASLPVAADVFLLFQRLRRQSLRSLGRPACFTLPALLRLFLKRRPPSRPAPPAQPFDFVQGWSGIETTGRWTDGRFAFLALYASAGKPPRAISLHATTIDTPDDETRIVTLSSGLNSVGKLAWSKRDPPPYAREVPIPPSQWRDDALLLRFHVHDRRIPIETGINFDTRGLGLCVHHVVVEAAVRDVTATPIEIGGDQPDLDVLWHGWSAPEPHGCWTHGRVAVIRWRQARAVTNATCEIDVTMAAPGPEPVRARMSLNGGGLSLLEMSPAAGPTVMRIPGLTMPAGQLAELRIEIDNPRAPAQSGIAGDHRPLGLSLRRIRLAAKES